MFATWQDYQDFLKGRTPKLQEISFDYFSDRASRLIIYNTYGNVKESTFPAQQLIDCTCLIAEMVQTKESIGDIVSENNDGYSVSYDRSKTFDQNVGRIIRQELTDWNGTENVFYSGVC